MSGPTQRELQVLETVVVVGGTPEAAAALGLSPHTVHGHLAHLRAKLGAMNTAQMYYIALVNGLLKAP